MSGNFDLDGNPIILQPTAAQQDFLRRLKCLLAGFDVALSGPLLYVRRNENGAGKVRNDL